MSAQDNSGAAYPVTKRVDEQGTDASGRPLTRRVSVHEEGMTKREAFAMAAMQGYCANADVNATPEAVAGWAVHQADALLAEMAKGGES